MAPFSPEKPSFRRPLSSDFPNTGPFKEMTSAAITRRVRRRDVLREWAESPSNAFAPRFKLIWKTAQGPSVASSDDHRLEAVNQETTEQGTDLSPQCPSRRPSLSRLHTHSPRKFGATLYDWHKPRRRRVRTRASYRQDLRSSRLRSYVIRYVGRRASRHLD